MARNSAQPLDIDKGDADSSFAKIPLDVLCETCGWLSPEDILALARTTKSFRSYLMSGTTRATIWRPALQALQHLEVPACPETIPEPQFIHLLFDNFCDDCGQGRVSLPIEDNNTIHPCYGIYKILCRDCVLKNYASFEDLLGEVPDFPWSYGDLPSMVPILYPCYPGMATARRSFLESGNEGRRWSMLLHIDSFRTLRERWEEGEDLITLEYEARVEREPSRKFAVECELFDSNKSEHDRKTKEQNKQDRLTWTKQRLSALGFDAEVKTFFHEPDRPLERTRHYDIYQEKFSVKDNQLMEYEWITMEDELVTLMRSEREWWDIRNGRMNVVNRISSYFQPAFIKFAFSEDPNAIIPTPMEVALMPEWVSVLGMKPYTDDPDASSIAKAITAIPAFAENIRKRRIHQLLDVVRKSKTYSERPEDVNIDTLSLASTIFRCVKCNECIHYPSVLVHICNYLDGLDQRNDLVPPNATLVEQQGANPESWPSRPINRQEEKAIVYAFSQKKDMFMLAAGFWNDLQNIEFGDAEHDHALVMLDSLGMDRKTPVEVMEKEQPYVKCLCHCFEDLTSIGEPKPVMRWMKALYTCEEHSKNEKRKKWFAKIDDKAHIALVREAELIRSTLSVQACFWKHTTEGRSPRLAEIGEYHRQFILWPRSKCHWDVLGIEHPEGDDARRKYGDARTLMSYAQLDKEKPLELAPTLRRSGRRKAGDPSDAEEQSREHDEIDNGTL